MTLVIGKKLPLWNTHLCWHQLISNIIQNAFLSFIGQPYQISSLLNMCRKSGKGLCTTKLCAWKTCTILHTNIFLSYVTKLQQKPPQSATPPTSVSSWCELCAENLAFTYWWRTIWQSKLKLTSFMTESVFKCAVLMPSKQLLKCSNREM